MPLEVKKCVQLHNAIVEYACDRLPPEHQPITQKNWFLVHRLGPRRPNLPVELDNNLKAFLRGVDVIHKEDGQLRAFCPFLIGLVEPHELLPERWTLNKNQEFILLYKNPGDHAGGLVYNRESQLVCYMQDIFSNARDQMWCDLHIALDLYLRCMQNGKFVIDCRNIPFGPEDYDPLASQGWRIEKWTETELAECLTIWSDLVDAITVRMPDFVRESSTELNNQDWDELGLVPPAVFDLYPAIPPFVRAFLSQAKKAPFAFIAPQLHVPDESFIHRMGSELQQRFPKASLATNQRDFVQDECPYFLLFPWRTQGISFASEEAREFREGTGQHVNDLNILDGRAGLYLASDEIHSHGSELLLPFQIGENGHLLASDGSKVNRPGHSALYRHGECCGGWIPPHRTPLTAILNNWWDQIEDNEWTIDQHGVAGGEELWKKADTPDGAQKFQASWNCFHFPHTD